MTLERIRKFDLSEPGGVEALIALHRSLFGDTRMEGDGDGEDGDGAGDGEDGDGSKDGKDSDGDGEDAHASALRAERTKVRDATTLLAELTGRSKTEVSRALRKGGDALEALKPAGGEGSEKSKASGKGGDEVDAEKIRAEARREAEEAATARIVRAEVRALAAETFANPADALHNLDLDDYEVDDAGALVDADKVRRDLEAVLKKYPHYKKAGARADRSQGRQGASGDRPKDPRELSRIRVED